MSQSASTRFAHRDLIERPTFIVSTPRAGSTLLFETLARSASLFTVGGESHRIIEGIPELTISRRKWSSNRLTEADAHPGIIQPLTQSFYEALEDREGRKAIGPVRMLEKTPKNALRVPFFNAIWPASTFIFLYRDPRPTLTSMVEAWLSGKFRTYPRLPGWDAWPWSLLLVPGWEQLKGLSLPQIVAHQWSITMQYLLSDLERLPRERVQVVTYEQFLGSPLTAVEALASAIGFSWDHQLDGELPQSKTTVSAPASEKWRAMERAITGAWPIVEETDRRAMAFVKDRLGGTTAHSPS